MAFGQGQVVDCAMVDGAAILSAMTYTFLGNGQWKDERGVNLLDTGDFYGMGHNEMLIAEAPAGTAAMAAAPPTGTGAVGTSTAR